MRCPKCHRLPTGVYDSRSIYSDTIRRRRRRCHHVDCGHVFTTYETVKNSTNKQLTEISEDMILLTNRMRTVINRIKQ